MKILKGYVRNRYRPEGCIVEGYIAEECVDFCCDYFPQMEIIGIPKHRHMGRFNGKGKLGGKVQSITRDERDKAHLYILQNSEEVQPYIEEHQAIIRREFRGRSEAWVQTQHNRLFANWFKVESCLNAESRM